MVRRRLPVPIAVLGLLLAACSSAPDASPVSSVAPPSQAQPSLPIPSPSLQPSPEAALARCAPEVEAGIEATLAGQLAAFEAGDFRQALGYASESFRSSVDVKTFRRLIRSRYPEVASARSHAITDCRQLGPRDAQALVSVTGEGGSVALVGYRFVLESDGWRIDGASTLDTATAQVA